MAGTGPYILVIADDGHEQELIVSTLREAGFAAVPAGARTHAPALWQRHFAAAVVALAEADIAAAVTELRALQAGLPLVLVVDAAASRPFDEDCATIVKRRPLDPRRL